jgi:hypothetical protein
MVSGDTRPGGSSRDALIAAVLEFLAGQDLLTRNDILPDASEALRNSR